MALSAHRFLDLVRALFMRNLETEERLRLERELDEPFPWQRRRSVTAERLQQNAAEFFAAMNEQ